MSFQSNNLLELQQFCTDFIVKSPEKIFKSLDFTSLTEKSLVSIIKRDDLQMKEIEVWEHILKWELAQNSTLLPDPNAWSDDDFKTLGNLRLQLFEDLLNSHLDPDSEPTDDISLPRNIKIDGIIDSRLVNLNIVSLD